MEVLDVRLAELPAGQPTVGQVVGLLEGLDDRQLAEAMRELARRKCWGTHDFYDSAFADPENGAFLQQAASIVPFQKFVADGGIAPTSVNRGDLIRWQDSWLRKAIEEGYPCQFAAENLLLPASLQFKARVEANRAAFGGLHPLQVNDAAAVNVALTKVRQPSEFLEILTGHCFREIPDWFWIAASPTAASGSSEAAAAIRQILER